MFPFNSIPLMNNDFNHKSMLACVKSNSIYKPYKMFNKSQFLTGLCNITLRLSSNKIQTSTEGYRRAKKKTNSHEHSPLFWQIWIQENPLALMTFESCAEFVRHQIHQVALVKCERDGSSSTVRFLASLPLIHWQYYIIYNLSIYENSRETK